MSAQILQFPKNKIVREFHLSDEDKAKIVNKQKREFAEYVLNELVRELYAHFEDFEFDTNDGNFVKDLSYTVDAARATIYRSLGLDHHLHEHIDENINLVDKVNSENDNGNDERETVR